MSDSELRSAIAVELGLRPNAEAEAILSALRELRAKVLTDPDVDPEAEPA